MGPCEESVTNGECEDRSESHLDVLVTLLERSGRDLDKKAAKAIKELRRKPHGSPGILAERAAGLLRHLFGGDPADDIFTLANKAQMAISDLSLRVASLEHEAKVSSKVRSLKARDDMIEFLQKELVDLRSRLKVRDEMITYLQGQVGHHPTRAPSPVLSDMPCYDPPNVYVQTAHTGTTGTLGASELPVHGHMIAEVAQAINYEAGARSLRPHGTGTQVTMTGYAETQAAAQKWASIGELSAIVRDKMDAAKRTGPIFELGRLTRKGDEN